MPGSAVGDDTSLAGPDVEAMLVDALDRARREGLTGHVVTARDGKRVRMIDGTHAVEFISFSYLGLEQHPALVEAACEGLRAFGVHFSTSRNRAKPGYLDELEELLSRIYLGNKAVVFSSVSSVHLGVLPLLGAGALPSFPVNGRGSTFLIERTAHSSMQILRGLLQKTGAVQKFDLQEPDSLQILADQAAASSLTPIVLVDGVGSTGGLVDVAAIAKAIEPFGGYLYVDDAHGISITGRNGAGYTFEACGGRLPGNVLIAGSLSKAFGGQGAFALLPSEADAAVLHRYAHPLVFGHSVMAPMLAANVAAARLHLGGEIAQLQAKLWHNVDEFDELTDNRLLNANLRSPVRAAMFATEAETLATAARLREQGVLALPAFYPMVPRGTGLIRFALSSLHQGEHLEIAAKALGALL